MPTDPPVVRTTKLSVSLPAPLPTARVEVREITMQPGMAAGLHVHNGPVFGTILTARPSTRSTASRPPCSGRATRSTSPPVPA